MQTKLKNQANQANQANQTYRTDQGKGETAHPHFPVLIVPREIAEVATQAGLEPEHLARLVLAAFVAGLDAEEPAFELPLRLVEQRHLDEVIRKTLSGGRN